MAETRKWEARQAPGNVEAVATLYYVGDEPVGGSPVADVYDSHAVGLIVAAPGMLDIIHRLCMSLASGGIDAVPGSNNPLESLHADALAVYGTVTGDDHPFATAMAGICAANRAILAAKKGD